MKTSIIWSFLTYWMCLFVVAFAATISVNVLAFSMIAFTQDNFDFERAFREYGSFILIANTVVFLGCGIYIHERNKVNTKRARHSVTIF